MRDRIWHKTLQVGDVADTKDRTKQKACLERYRKACIQILGVLNKAAPQVGHAWCSQRLTAHR